MESQIAIIKSQDTISMLEMKKVIIEQRRVSLNSMVLAGLCVLLCFGPVVEAFKPAGISSPARFHRTSFAIEAKDSKPKAPKAKVEIAKITPEEREKYFKLVDDTFISTTLTNLIDRGDIDYDPKIMNKLGKQKKKEKNTAKQLTGYNFTNYLNEESNIPFIDEPRWYRILTKRSAENSVGDSLEYYSQVPKSVLQQAVEQVYVPKAPSYYFTGSAKSERRYLSVRYARPKFSCCVFIKCKMSPDIAEEIESVEGVRGMMKMPEGFVAPMDQEQQKMIEEMVATPPPEMPAYMKEIQMGEYVSIVGGTEAGKYGIVEGVQSNRLAVRVRSEGKEDTIESIAITDVRYLPNPPEKHYRLLTSKEMLQMLLERDPKNPQIRTLLRTGAGADLINAQAELGPPMPYLRGSLERDSNRDRPRNGGDRRDDFRNDRRPDNNRRDGGFNNRESNNRDGSFGTRSSYTRDGEMRSSNMQSKANDNRNNKREESTKSSIDHDLLSWMNDDPKPNKETSSPSWGVGDDIKSNPATNSKKSKKDDFEDYDENEVIWAGATDEFSAKYFQQPEENEEPASKTKQTKDKVDDFDRMFGLDDDSDLYDYEGSSARSTKASTAKNTVSRSVQNTVASKPDSNKDGAPQPQDFQNFADYINALVAYQKGGKNSAGVANVMSQGSNRATDSLRKASKEVMETTNTGDYDNLQVKDMKRLLKDQGLSQTGNKDELRSRLIQNKVPIV